MAILSEAEVQALSELEANTQFPWPWDKAVLELIETVQALRQRIRELEGEERT